MTSLSLLLVPTPLLKALVKRTPGSNLESSMSNTSVTSPFSSVPSAADDKARSASVSALRRHQSSATPSTLSPTDRPQGGFILGEGIVGMQLIGGEELAKFHQMLAKQLAQSQDIVLSLLVRTT